MSTVSPPTIGAQLYLDGAWVDISGDTAGNDTRITAARGRPNESGDLQPSRLNLTLLDGPTDPTTGAARIPGQYQPRNTASPYYGLLGINTPIRYVEKIGTDTFTRSTSNGWGTADSGQAWVQDGGTTANYSTNGTVGLMTLTAANAAHEMVLGTAVYGSFHASFTVKPAVVALTQAMQVSMTFRRVDASNNYIAVVSLTTGGFVTVLIGKRVAGVATAYISSTVTGYDATTVLQVDVYVSQGLCELTVTDTNTGFGEGSVSASLEESTLTQAGTIGLRAIRLTGNTNVNPAIQFDDLSIVDPRVTAEVPAWPQSRDSTNKDIRVAVDARGLSGRLGQGNQVLHSIIYRYFIARGLSGYWPLEDGSGATVAASAVTGVAPMNVSGVTFGSDEDMPGSDGVMTLDDTGSFFAAGNSKAGNGVQWYALWWMKLAAAPGATTNVLTVRTNGSARRYVVGITSASGLQITAFDGAGTSLGTTTLGLSAAEVTQWAFFKLTAEQNGANVDLAIDFGLVAEADTVSTSATVSFAGTLGTALTVENTGNTNIDGIKYTHMALYNSGAFGVYDLQLLDLFDIVDLGGGFAGEASCDRMRRLCLEEGVRIRVADDTTVDSAPMGAQRSNTFLGLLQDCADVDGGVLYEPRDFLGFAYRTYTSLYNQPIAVTLSYSASEPSMPFLPVPDDSALRNDITVSRLGGSSVRRTKETGPLSVATVGTYPGGGTFNAESDGQLTGLAGWELRLGTVDEERWPMLRTELQRTELGATLAATLASLDVGDMIAVTDMPAGLPLDDVLIMAQGTTEIRTNLTRELSYNASPGTPWEVFTVESTGGDGNNRGRVDTSGSSLAAAATSSATSLLVSTQIGPLWSKTASGYDLWIAGERVRVTAVAQDSITDTFTRSTSNGWGTATSGQAWSVVGTAADYSTTGALGRIATTTINTLYLAHVDTSSTDHAFGVAVTVPVLPSGAPITVRVAGRLVDASNYYEAQISISTAGAVSLFLNKRVAGVGSVVVTGPVLADTHSAGNTWMLGIRCVGTQIEATAWKSTSTQPGGYLISTTDSSLTAGTRVGCLARRETSNTNGAQNIDFDTAAATNPQTLTVTRGVNGVSKAQVAGDAVNLFHPPGYSL